MATSNFFAASSGDNSFTRKFGTSTSTIDPYISGYMFIKFLTIPSGVYSILGVKRPGLFTKDSDIPNILASLCQSVTIPGRTVNKVENVGLGGIRWSAPSNVDEDNTISMRFLETQDIPIHSIFHSWVRLIRDNRSGVSLLRGSQATNGQGGSKYTKSDYSSTLYYWTTAPNGVDIQFAACYSGLFPMKDPSDLFGHDLAANDKLEIDIDFSTDYCYQEDWVRIKVMGLSDEYSSKAFNASQIGANPTGITVDGYNPDPTAVRG